MKAKSLEGGNGRLAAEELVFAELLDPVLARTGKDFVVGVLACNAASMAAVHGPSAARGPAYSPSAVSSGASAGRRSVGAASPFQQPVPKHSWQADALFAPVDRHDGGEWWESAAAAGGSDSDDPFVISSAGVGPSDRDAGSSVSSRPAGNGEGEGYLRVGSGRGTGVDTLRRDGQLKLSSGSEDAPADTDTDGIVGRRSPSLSEDPDLSTVDVSGLASPGGSSAGSLELGSAAGSPGSPFTVDVEPLLDCHLFTFQDEKKAIDFVQAGLGIDDGINASCSGPGAEHLDLAIAPSLTNVSPIQACAAVTLHAYAVHHGHPQSAPLHESAI